MNGMFDLEFLMELVEKREFRRLKELLMEMNGIDVASFMEELSSRGKTAAYHQQYYGS